MVTYNYGTDAHDDDDDKCVKNYRKLRRKEITLVMQEQMENKINIRHGKRMDWIQIAHDKDQWRALVVTAVKLPVRLW
jgi:hypothetical protein